MSADRIIPYDRSIIVAADVDSIRLRTLVKKTCLIEGIGGYKIGLQLALQLGLPDIVARVKDHTNLPLIYDHQKAGNDIPETGAKFARVCKNAGVDAVILFPFAGAKSERDWIKACQDLGLGVIVGAHMTQPEFLFFEGGFLSNDAPEKIFTIAANSGVRDFVVPGNKAGYVIKYRRLLEDIVGIGQFRLYAPGFITQGGEISEFTAVAGMYWHAIVGRDIYNAVDISNAASQMTKNIR